MLNFDTERLKERALSARMMSRAMYYSMVKLRDTSEVTPVHLVEHWARVKPNNLAIISHEGQYNYQQFDRRANQVARVLQQQGAQENDSIALIMDSRPEFLFSVVGAAKLGMVTGLINTNLVGDQLKHALKICQSKWIIVGSEHIASVEAVIDDLEIPRGRVFVWNETNATASLDGSQDMQALVLEASSEALGLEAAYKMNNPFVYICTSGTTGLPKAAMVRNQRFLQACYYFGQAVLELNSQDIMYTAGLPLYHNTAISQAWGVALTGGGAVAMRRRFSASRFWEDCDEFGVTMFTYVGEVCRYLVKAEVQPKEKAHRIRCVLGAGLRPDIWEEFKTRFSIEKIYEYYGATEGNVGLINLSGKPGMVGRIAPARGHVLAKVDPETEEMVKVDGHLVAAGVGESGILVAKIGPMAKFEGYVDQSKNASKILDNPFGKGDRYFNTGDMLTLHEDNWVSFADRLGDTFRWKGENVSTNDVQEAVSKCEGVKEANAYGVEVPGCDGRAGMVAIVVEPGFDIQRLGGHVATRLPAYSRPLFVRIEESLPMTGSYKYVKTGFKAEGFNPQKISTPLYFLQDGSSYVELDASLNQQICAGELRL